MDQANKYVNYILAHQSDNGWLGPDDDTSGNMYWSKFPALLSLAAYAEAEPKNAPTIAAAMLKFMKEAYRRMAKTPLSDWSMWRGMDFALAVQWLMKHHPQDQAEFLADLLTAVRQQTSNWEAWFTNFTVGASPHGVNNAQALKSSGVWAVQDADPALHDSSRERLRNMDDYYGMASGMFCADEILCEPAQRKMPSRGTELCAVVEAMFSYNTLFSVHGAEIEGGGEAYKCCLPPSLFLRPQHCGLSSRSDSSHFRLQPCASAFELYPYSQATSLLLIVPSASPTMRYQPPLLRPWAVTCGITSTCRRSTRSTP